MQISKELFEAVQNRTNVDNIWIEDDHLHIEYINSDTIQYLSVNDFYFQCKQWILSKDYYCSVYSFNFSMNREQEHRIRLLLGNDVVYSGNDSCEETEQEALIKAAEWVLGEINANK